MTRYVSPLGNGAMNGTSWANAFPGTSLQTAIDASAVGDEVWVAAGTYTPTPLADRNAAFAMRNGVAIYGGFQGTETSLAQRRITCGQYSVLSGEIGAPGNADNSYHIVRNGNLNATAILDGFVVRDANNDRAISADESGNGGGIYNGGSGAGNNSSPTIRNCIITQNTARYGAGIFNNAFNGGTASINISHCIIAYNTALEGGGGIDFFAADGGTALPIISNTLVCNNVAQNITGGQGAAGMYLWGGLCSPTIINSAFVNNVSQGMGGGMIIDNTPLFGGVSGMVTVNVQNSIFFGNTAVTNGPQFTIKAGGNFSATYSLVDMTSAQQTPFPISGAGTGNITMLNPNFVNIANPMGADACWLTADDGLQLQNSSPCLNAGNNTGVSSATDIWSVPRILGGTVDIGAFEYRALGITSFSPTASGTGGTITITGTGFIGTSIVRFGGIAAATFTIDNDSQITATLANGTSGNVEVVAAGTASLAGFTFVVPLPTVATISTGNGITSFSPTIASAGTTIIITGNGFAGTTSVSFGGIPAASFTVLSNTQITAVLASGTPSIGGQQAVVVTTPIGVFSLGGLFIGASASGNPSSGNPSSSSGAAAPQRAILFNFEPRTFSFGTPILLRGFGFTGATGLLLGGVPVASFVVVNDNTISATVGGIPMDNRVILTGGLGANGDMSGFGLTYLPLPPPIITTLSPSRVAASDADMLLTLSARNVLNGAVMTMIDDQSTTFQSTPLQVQQQTANTILITFPAALQSVGTRRIVLTNPDGQTVSVTLAIVRGNMMRLLNDGAPLVISTIASGQAFSVRLAGMNLPRTVQAFVGDVSARVNAQSSTEAIVEIPASLNAVGGIDYSLRLLAKDGQTSSATLRIERRAPPTILSVALQSSVLIHIRGLNFMTGIRVTLGVTPLQVARQDGEREIFAHLPPSLLAASGSPTITLLVENPDGRAHALILPISVLTADRTNASVNDEINYEINDDVTNDAAVAATTSLSNKGTSESNRNGQSPTTQARSVKQKTSIAKAIRINPIIYPNPAEDEMHIVGSDITAVSIYDAGGCVVLETSCKHSLPLMLNLRGLPHGVYLVVIKDKENNRWGQPLIKN